MSKISLGQLDLLALQQYLEIVVGFTKKDDKAKDVQYVGEYEHFTVNDTDDAEATEKSKVEANQVAMAWLDDLGKAQKFVCDNGEIIPERQTVLNSIKLGGYEAGDFLKITDESNILADVNQANYNLSNDIRNLKDELYQLKNQLVKVGTLKDSNVYNGFIDSFIGSNQKHVISSGVKVARTTSTSIFVESTGNLTAGEIIVLEDKKNFRIEKIEEIRGLELVLDTKYKWRVGSDITFEEGTIVKKSLGVSNGGKFVFAREADEGEVVADEFKFIVKDGIDRIKVFELDHGGHGFGTEIKIPASLANSVINKIQVSLAVKGNPGEIFGTFWKYDDATVTFSKTDYYTGSVGPMEASGWFNNFTMELVNPMRVNPGEIYILILETTSGSANDKWYIGGFSEEDCLDDVHNDCYIQSNELLYKSIEDKDMFLSLNVKELKASDIERLPYGVYTCDFDVHLTRANRIRVEMCINQEGLFKVTDANSFNMARKNVSEIPIEPKGGKIFGNQVFCYENGKQDIVIIGNEIATVTGCGSNNSSISVADDTYIANNADVYRVGYDLQVVVSNKQLETVIGGYATRLRNDRVFPLKLVGVVPGRDIIRPFQSSDRLIFECEFESMNDDEVRLESYDHLQLQIVWHSNRDINSYVLEANEELEGAILDLTVSVDQAYIKSPNNPEGV